MSECGSLGVIMAMVTGATVGIGSQLPSMRLWPNVADTSPAGLGEGIGWKSNTTQTLGM